MTPDRLRRGVSAAALPVLVLLALVVIGHQPDLIDAAAVAGLWAFAAVGLDLVWGYAGRISLGHAGFAAVGAYATAVLTVNHGWGAFSAMAVGVVLNVVVAAALGFAVLRLSEVYLALATLGFGLMVPALIVAADGITNGSIGLFGVPVIALGRASIADPLSFFVLAWALAFIAALGVRRVARSRTGLAMRAVAEQPDLASVAGVNVAGTARRAFVASAVPSSIAGSLFAHFSIAVTPTSFGFGLLILLLVYVIVGGRATGWGALVGALVVTVAQQYTGATGQLAELTYGVVLVAILYLVPRGLVGSLTRGPVSGAPRDNVAAEARRAAEERPPVRPAENSPSLRVVGASKHFGGVVAVNDVSLELRPGEIHGLVGPNGAGKSTLLNLITGLTHADSGEVRLGDTAISGLPVHRRAALGLARTFQTPQLVGDLSVLDNVAMGCIARRKRKAARWSAFSRRELAEMRLAAATERAVLGQLDLMDVKPEALSFGQRRMVEMARATVGSPSVLLLDEPLSGLDTDEKDQVCTLLDRLRERGIAVGLVEHDIESVTRLCDRITVLVEGAVLTSGDDASVFSDERVRAAYLGGAPQAVDAAGGVRMTEAGDPR
jgi:branched-chain amino acid transport system ATP-binding protein/branched-chain amino acid transport system permease protein